VVTLVGRSQGLLVQKGNPKEIHSLADLTRQDVAFINRQRGSGTRVLLDYHLARHEISPEDIQGYQQQEYTHLTVGAAITSGRADCGIGISAVTQSLDLEFIPLFEERYDLIIPREHAGSMLIAPLLELLGDPDFIRMVQSLPGYDVSQMGSTVAELS
jgi:putative molybdopterin biosynthesis protein